MSIPCPSRSSSVSEVSPWLLDSQRHHYRRQQDPVRGRPGKRSKCEGTAGRRKVRLALVPAAASLCVTDVCALQRGHGSAGHQGDGPEAHGGRRQDLVLDPSVSALHTHTFFFLLHSRQDRGIKKDKTQTINTESTTLNNNTRHKNIRQTVKRKQKKTTQPHTFIQT